MLFPGWLGMLVGASGLVVVVGVEDQFADEFAGFGGTMMRMYVGCEDGDFGAGEVAAESDVVEPAVVPDGDGAGCCAGW